MAFVNLSLLVGVLLLAIPIVLHLAMRQRPKHLLFPAVRFVRLRRQSNQRKLQLRHWLLLLLRCAVIGLLAAALARPSIAAAGVGDWIMIGVLAALLLGLVLLASIALAQRRGAVLTGGLAGAAALVLAGLVLMASHTLNQSGEMLIGDQEAPVAAVLAFDTSPRMQYRQENKTRLQQAQETAHWLAGQLPSDSEVAVVDSRPGGSVFAVDLAAARRAIERLQTTGAPWPLTNVLDEALHLAKSSDLARKEVYVFTDMARSAWSAESAAALKRRLAESSEVLVYVIDVGAENPQNFALGELALSGQVLSKNSELRVQTELTHVGPGGERTVELHLENPDPTRPIIQDGKTLLPESRRRASQVRRLEANGAETLQFRFRGLELGVHHGFVKIIGEDGLAIDDERYFTVEVKEAWPVLVAAPPGVAAGFLTEALAPYEYRKTGQARFVCTVIPQAELINHNLSPYAAVCLLDPAPLPPAGWEKLARYVGGGGGLAVFLGHNAQPVADFNEPAAQQLLAGSLTRPWRAGGRDLFLAPRTLDHPIMAEFRPLAASVPWNRFPVFMHWGLDRLAPESRVIIHYGNNQPALVEKPLGKGRVLTMTTPISDPARPPGRRPWNELPTGEDAWPYFVLANEMLLYLVDSGETNLNYLAGETAVLSNHPDRDPDRYQLFTPRNETQDVMAQDGQIVVKFTENPGAYRLKGYRGGPVVRGFSVNLPPETSDLTRTSPESLEEILGPGRFQFARSRDEIQREIGEARRGREFYPFLIALLALMLALEHTLANRFYRKNE